MFRQNIPKPELKKISDFIWEIPPSYKKGMLVPARFFMTKKLVDDLDLNVFDQITNVAALPGLVRAAMCMPDGHSGYGFPIGGVAAADINKGGIISPGGIGFDVNCLPPEAKISLANGTWKTIGELDSNWQGEKILFFDADKKSTKCINPIAFMKRLEENELCEITTESGRKIKTTGDHPILTTQGFIEAKNLELGKIIYSRPFSGIRYECPPDETIISQEDIEKTIEKKGITNIGNAKSQVLRFLKKLKLNEIKYNSPKLPILLKLMGFIFGDGCIYFTKKNRKGCIGFYGKKEDLDSIKKDLVALGLKAQNIFSRKRKHSIKTHYGTSKFEYLENSLFKKSTALAILLVTLGVPHGIKTAQQYRIPKWIMKAPLWQKRLFLAAFFGAELSSPKTTNKYNFYEPQLNMNKLESLKENGEEFLNDIRLLLSEFGIISAYPATVEGNNYFGKNGKTIGLRLNIRENSENLTKLYELVGYEYNKTKSNLAALAASYMRIKGRIVAMRSEARNTALQMYETGKNPAEIRGLLRDTYISDNFINHSIWPDRSDETRVPPNFLSFEEYKSNLAGEGIVLEKIEKIECAPYSGPVYDLTIGDKNHNFIADNFVTHNCGMRLVLTNLTHDDIKPHLKTLVDSLYKKVPAGAGGHGFVKITKDEFKHVLREGGKWAVENGYGWPEDLERTELNGIADWADVGKVSEKAIERGYNQIGTLGSGNHYLEIQVVKKENIKDEKLAKKWGLFPNQVVIMFHTGSRGEGHQIATDYLSKFLEVMESKYKIKILDRNLACAPFNSPEGQDYWKAMACAVNFSFANRQTILHRIREVFSEVLKQDAEKLGLRQVFDIAHNRATLEKHNVDGEMKELLVHRKGATAAYPPGRKEIPKLYREDGSPVIIGGSMETGSYLLAGTEGSNETFCSTAHGSGRTMSRAAAVRKWHGKQLYEDMLKKGIYVRSVSWEGLAEEAGPAYKDIDEVIDATAQAGISKKVVKFVPIGNVKGAYSASYNIFAFAMLAFVFAFMSALI